MGLSLAGARKRNLIPIVAVTILAVLVGATTTLAIDPQGGVFILGAMAMTVVSCLLAFRHPDALVIVFMVTLVAAPTVAVHDIPVSLIDAVAIGTLAAAPFVVDLSALRRGVAVASGIFFLVLIVSLVPRLLSGNEVAGTELLKAVRVGEVLLVPLLLLGRVKVGFAALVTSLTVVGAVALAAGILAFHAGLQLSYTSSQLPLQYLYLPGEVVARATGVTGESSTFGDLAAVEVILAWLLATSTKSTILLAFGLLCAGLGALALLTAYSRASLLFLVTAVVAILLFHPTRARALLLLSGLAMAGCLAIVFFEPRLIAPFLTLRIGVGANGNFDLASGRFTTWPLVLGKFASAPNIWPLGTGYKSLSTDPTNPLGFLPGDNNYLSALVETGVVGLAAMLAWVCSVGVYILRSEPSYTRLLAIGLWAGLIAEALVTDAFTYFRVVGLLVLSAALLARAPCSGLEANEASRRFHLMQKKRTTQA